MTIEGNVPIWLIACTYEISKNGIPVYTIVEVVASFLLDESSIVRNMHERYGNNTHVLRVRREVTFNPFIEFYKEDSKRKGIINEKEV